MNSKHFFGLAGLLLCGVLSVGCAHSDECDCEQHHGEPVYSQHQPQHQYHESYGPPPEYIEPVPGHPGPGYPPTHIPGPADHTTPAPKNSTPKPMNTTPKPMNTTPMNSTPMPMNTTSMPVRMK